MAIRAFSSGSSTLGALRGCQAALGLFGRSSQGMNARSLHGERRVAGQGRVVELPEPRFDLLAVAAAGRPKRYLLEDQRGPVGVTPRQRVLERRFRVAVRQEPVGGAAAELLDELRLGLEQLPSQQLTEETVVAPPTVTSGGGQEEVRASQRLELLERALLSEHGIAQGARELREHGGAPQEPQLFRREHGQVLGLEVLSDIRVVGGGDAANRTRAPPARDRPRHRQRLQVQAPGPSFRPLDQVCEIRVGQLRSNAPQQQLRFAACQREVVEADLEQAGVTAQLRGQVGLGPPGENECRPGGNVLGNDCQHLVRVASVHDVQVVDHEHTLLCGCDQPFQLRDQRRPDRRFGRGQRVEETPADRHDGRQRCDEVAQEHNGIAVAPVERDPGKCAVVTRGPLREQRRLAVAAGRDDRDDGRRSVRTQPVDERGSRNGAGPDGRRADLRRDDAERQFDAVRFDENGLRSGSTG